jgi:hypothetical protein
MIQHFQTRFYSLHREATPVGTLKSPSDRTRVGAILGTIQADWPRPMILFSMAETRLSVTTMDRQYTLEASMPLTVLSEPKVTSAIVSDIQDAVFLIEGLEEPSIPYARQIRGISPVIAEIVSYTGLTHQPVPGRSLGTCQLNSHRVHCQGVTANYPGEDPDISCRRPVRCRALA